MALKLLTIITASLFSISSFGQGTGYIDPTGVYKLESKTVKKKGETYGYFGEVNVIAIDTNRILVSFYVCKGAPSYNSGSFTDTLTYKSNIAIYYGDSISDPTCHMTMAFNKKGIEVDLKTDNLDFLCGFGHSVYPQGFYYRVIGLIPQTEEIRNTR